MTQGVFLVGGVLLVLTFMVALGGAAVALESSESPSPVPSPTVAPSEPPATEPPATEPPATEPPASEPPAQDVERAVREQTTVQAMGLGLLLLVGGANLVVAIAGGFRS